MPTETEEGAPNILTPGHRPLSAPDERAAALGAAWLALAVFALAYYALESLLDFNR